MNQETKISEVIETLNQIEKDFTVPKNVRAKIKCAFAVLEKDCKPLPIRIDESIQELDEVSDDPNIPSYTRTQIWNILSILESIES